MLRLRRDGTAHVWLMLIGLVLLSCERGEKRTNAGGVASESSSVRAAGSVSVASATRRAVDAAKPAASGASSGQSPRAFGDVGEPCPTSVRSKSARVYSYQGYARRAVRLKPDQAGTRQQHCLTVLWPPGATNNDGEPSTAAKRIDASWVRLLENTLARVPIEHAKLLQRVVIDNRPKKHGIAPFDRQAADDARDGHTIWLHEHLFLEPNHWERGNYGSYWAYHVDQDGLSVKEAPPDHDLFSPVLLHELGHLVMYHIANAPLEGPAATSAPDCAHTCIEAGKCADLGPGERERGCVSPYCKPFSFEASTENWAEQYRFFYQSSLTRELLLSEPATCGGWLSKAEKASSQPEAPWERGLPDMQSYQQSRWESCGGSACKRW